MRKTNPQGRRAVAAKSLAQQIAPQMRLAVKELLAAERDAAGLDFQMSRVGAGRVGVEAVLTPLYRNVDRRFGQIAGVKPQGDYADPTQIRGLIDTIGGFFAAFGVSIDTVKLPTSFESWVDDPQVWEELAAPHGGRRTVPKWELIGISPRDLRPDGSLRRPLPEFEEAED